MEMKRGTGTGRADDESQGQEGPWKAEIRDRDEVDKLRRNLEEVLGWVRQKYGMKYNYNNE